MPFIRQKTVKGKVYYYLCEGIWEDGKVRQKVLLYLGKFESVQQAYHHWQGQVTAATAAKAKSRARAMVKKLEPYL